MYAKNQDSVWLQIVSSLVNLLIAVCNIACMTQLEKVYCNYYSLILYLIYIQMTQDSSVIASPSLFWSILISHFSDVY